MKLTVKDYSSSEPVIQLSFEFCDDGSVNVVGTTETGEGWELLKFDDVRGRIYRYNIPDDIGFDTDDEGKIILDN